MPEQTPEQKFNEIYTMLKMMGSDVKNNKEQIQLNVVCMKEFAAGMADHDKRINSLDKLINMMVDCGTAKDLEKEIVNLNHRIKVASVFISDLIASIKAETMEIHPHDRDVLLAKLKDIEFKLQKDD